jgi:uncharacterized caspase-like protein
MLQAALILFVFLCPSVAHAEKRVALMIGNSAYLHVPKLPNPRKDAEAIAHIFREAGFDLVDGKVDLGADAMRRTLREFSQQVRDVDVAVVFYAGHGIEMNGVNYLIPVDATLQRDIDVEDEAVTLDRVIRTIEPARRLQLVILDSCRDNPFLGSMQRTIVSRSLHSGLGDIDERGLPPNTLIAYSQQAGLTADDAAGANSPYTTALLKHLFTPGLDVELALRRVRDEVMEATHNRQRRSNTARSAAPRLYSSQQRRRSKSRQSCRRRKMSVHKRSSAPRRRRERKHSARMMRCAKPRPIGLPR